MTTAFPENKVGHMRARMRRVSKSKLQRRPRPASVEFGVVGVAVGGGCGMLGGLIIEFTRRPSALVMFVGALIGMASGGLVELVRFLWRKHTHRNDPSP